jgi:hypothetical protein
MSKTFDPDFEGLDKTDEELRREMGRARMNAPVQHDWYRRGSARLEVDFGS